MGILGQRERCGEPEGAGEPPKIREGGAAAGQASNRGDWPSSAQMAERVRADLEHGEDRGANEGKNEKPDDRGLEAQDQSADARRRRAQAAEIDKGYEEKLEGFSYNLQALRQEAKGVDPEHSTPLLLDGMRLHSFILSSDFVPPERGRKRLGTILLIGIACVVVAPIAYYFAVGNPFPSRSNESRLRPEIQDAKGLPGVSKPVSDAGHEPAASARTSSAVPLTSALASAPAYTSGMGSDEIQLLLKQGQEFVAAGDLATARVVLRRAAEAGAAAAAFALAQCYDPKVLTQMRARGIAPDIGEARRWYEVARQRGSAEAARHLELLPPD